MENDDSNKKQNIINLLREYAQIQMVNGYGRNTNQVNSIGELLRKQKKKLKR